MNVMKEDSDIGLNSRLAYKLNACFWHCNHGLRTRYIFLHTRVGDSR